MMETSSLPEYDASSESDTPYTPYSAAQDIPTPPPALDVDADKFSEWANGAGIVLLHDLTLRLELIRKTFCVQLPEWLLQKVLSSEVTDRTQEAVWGTLASAAEPDGELILAGDIYEALWSLISNSMHTSLPPIRKADTPLLEELFESFEPIDLVLMPDDMSETLRLAFPFILSSCHTIKTLTCSMFSNDEYAWRRPVDNLIELAFIGSEGDTTVPLEVMYNTPLTIPNSTSAYPIPFTYKCTIADTSIFTPKHRFFTTPTPASNPLEIRNIASSLLHPLLMDLHILQFVVEFERDSDLSDMSSSHGGSYRENNHVERLICHLGTAQYQRRVIGFSDHSVYGIACSKGVVKAFVSWWEIISGQTESRIYVHEIASFNLYEPLETLRFFIFLLNVKEDIDATYNADLWHLELKDVSAIEHAPGLRCWRSTEREDDLSEDREDTPYENGRDETPDTSNEENEEIEERCSGCESQCTEENEDGYQEYRDEASLDQPLDDNDDKDDKNDKHNDTGANEVPLVRRLADLVMKVEISPHANDLYNSLFIDRDTSIRSLLGDPTSDDDDEEDDEDEFHVHYAYLSSPPLPSPREPPESESSTPRPHLTHNTTSDMMVSNIHTWTAWEKESLDYEDDRAKFYHEAFCECDDGGDMRIKVEGVDSGMLGLGALD